MEIQVLRGHKVETCTQLWRLVFLWKWKLQVTYNTYHTCHTHVSLSLFLWEEDLRYSVGEFPSGPIVQGLGLALEFTYRVSQKPQSKRLDLRQRNCLMSGRFFLNSKTCWGNHRLVPKCTQPTSISTFWWWIWQPELGSYLNKTLPRNLVLFIFRKVIG